MNDKTTKEKKPTRSIQHPLFGISIRRWISLMKQNGGIDLRYLDKAMFVTVTSVLTAPARILFHIKYGTKIAQQNITPPPVFIIGHWRSGTTYLHELLSNDPQFCYTSLWDTLLPDSGLVLRCIKRFLARFLPPERPMDAIKVEMDGPYEDEAALAVLSPWSFFHCLHFPRNAEEQYCKSIHFQDLSAEELKQWKDTYKWFIQMVMFAHPGKRFLSKNPPNTARLSTLLEIFPDACFIHIYRNPYLVYLSTKKMRMRVLDKLALQQGSEEEINTQVTQNYIRLMTSFFEQQDRIPKHRFVEIRYEDLTRDPIGQVKHIYEKLQLPGFENGLPGMQKYLDHHAEYKTNVYTIDNKILDHVKINWKFTLDRWGYAPPK
jgi:uncharacterized protein (UPF0248 family)